MNLFFSILSGFIAVLFCASLSWHPPKPPLRLPARVSQHELLQWGLALYYQDTKTYPTSFSGLAALRTNLDGVPNWKGPYVPAYCPVFPFVYTFPGHLAMSPDFTRPPRPHRPKHEFEDTDIVAETQKHDPQH